MGAMLDFLRLAGLDLTPAPPAAGPRDELKRCRQATIEARSCHERELAIVARLRSLELAAAEAEREAEAAELAYEGSIGEWARGDSDGTVGNGELARRAETARARANRAQLAASGADKALTARDWDTFGNPAGARTTPEELAARVALRNAESAERLARGPILAATIEPVLDEFETLMARARELDADLQEFEAFATYGNGRFGGSASILERYRGARRLDAISTNQVVRSRLRISWARFDNRLKQDPESKFDV